MVGAWGGGGGARAGRGRVGLETEEGCRGAVHE